MGEQGSFPYWGDKGTLKSIISTTNTQRPIYQYILLLLSKEYTYCIVETLINHPMDMKIKRLYTFCYNVKQVRSSKRLNNDRINFYHKYKVI